MFIAHRLEVKSAARMTQLHIRVSQLSISSRMGVLQVFDSTALYELSPHYYLLRFIMCYSPCDYVPTI